MSSSVVDIYSIANFARLSWTTHLEWPLFNYA